MNEYIFTPDENYWHGTSLGSAFTYSKSGRDFYDESEKEAVDNFEDSYDTELGDDYLRETAEELYNAGFADGFAVCFQLVRDQLNGQIPNNETVTVIYGLSEELDQKIENHWKDCK